MNLHSVRFVAALSATLVVLACSKKSSVSSTSDAAGSNAVAASDPKAGPEKESAAPSAATTLAAPSVATPGTATPSPSAGSANAGGTAAPLTLTQPAVLIVMTGDAKCSPGPIVATDSTLYQLTKFLKNGLSKAGAAPYAAFYGCNENTFHYVDLTVAGTPSWKSLLFGDFMDQEVNYGGPNNQMPLIVMACLGNQDCHLYAGDGPDGSARGIGIPGVYITLHGTYQSGAFFCDGVDAGDDCGSKLAELGTDTTELTTSDHIALGFYPGKPTTEAELFSRLLSRLLDSLKKFSK